MAAAHVTASLLSCQSPFCRSFRSAPSVSAQLKVKEPIKTGFSSYFVAAKPLKRTNTRRTRVIAAATSEAPAGAPFVGHDYYKILGVAPDAEPVQIRKAYWQLMKTHHPDLSGEQVRDTLQASVNRGETLEAIL